MFKNPYFRAAQISLLLSIAELTASTPTHKIDNLDEYESMRFVRQYFSSTQATYNGYQGFEVNNIYYGDSYYNIQQAFQPISFYGFRNTNFMADRYLDIQNIHAFFFRESYTLLSKLLTLSDNPNDTNADEYWTALIFYRFLKPRAIYHAVPFSNIDRITTLLCNNTDDEQVLRLFNRNHTLTEDPEYESASAEIQSILSSDALTAPGLVHSAFLGIPYSPERAGMDRTSPHTVEDSDDETREDLEQYLKSHGFADDPESPQNN